MNSIYAVNTPYPQITGVCSPCDIRMIMDLYAGRTGELTSTTQYLYEHYVIDGIHALLGEAITKLGGDPIMGGSTCFWSGSNLKYTKNPICFLQNSLQSEQNAVSNYRRAASCVKNSSLSELFLRIAEDEVLHIQILEDLLEEISQ